MILKLCYFLVILFYIIPAHSDPIEMPDNIQHYKDVKLIIPNDLFETIKLISENILNDCLPSDCVVVGVGRSPTPIIEYLDAKIPGYTIKLPLSNFKHIKYARSKELPAVGMLSDNMKEKLFQYFDYIFEGRIDSEVKRVKLIDFGFNGTTLFATQIYLDEYLEKTYPKIILNTSLITDNKSVQRIKEIADGYNLKRPNFYGLKQHSTALKAFKDGQFEGFSEFKAYDILDEDGLPERNFDNRVQVFKNYIRDKVNYPLETLKRDCVITQSIILMGL